MCCLTTCVKAGGKEINLRCGVVLEEPFVMIDTTAENSTDGPRLTGYVIDMVRRLVAYAEEDGYCIAIDMELANEHAPGAYTLAINLVASDCNTAANLLPFAWCQRFDFICGALWTTSSRAVHTNFSPAFLRSTMTTIKVVKEDSTQSDFMTVSQAEERGGEGSSAPRPTRPAHPRSSQNFQTSSTVCVLAFQNVLRSSGRVTVTFTPRMIWRSATPHSKCET